LYSDYCVTAYDRFPLQVERVADRFPPLQVERVAATATTTAAIHLHQNEKDMSLFLEIFVDYK